MYINKPNPGGNMSEADSGMRVWIDQDLCTGDGLCAEIVPEVFFPMDDGLYYVKEDPTHYGTEKLFDGVTNPAGAVGLARFPLHLLAKVVEAAEECPGECIFIEGV